ncbi:hypothetical protein OG689_41755 [Kitasatospora sp. NBC_00240]|uniref:hypothetical protein n=1 Tax=Kitasatospora sp. NBC_00240 TaxID=2903567 RepID=UPI00225A4342|nr:hypothetical protein [Kitasatospora sp. NBC_00240]MCX5215684.1 hypothetical protein [Kitasatospora sp. NBC_00240]
MPVNRHSRALKTRDINEVFVQQLKEREDMLRQNHVWLAPALDQLSSGRPVSLNLRAPQSMSVADHADLVDVASHVGIFRMWARRGRVTYDLNEHMAAELYRSTYTKLPGDVFSHLPHINPLVVLPDPWPITFNGSSALVRGFFVFGFNQHPEQQTYTDDEIEGLGLMFVIDLLDDDSYEVRGQTYVRMNIPTGAERFTLRQAVNFAAARAEAHWSRVSDERPVYALFEELLRPALSILVYLSCDNRDLAEPPVVKPTRRKRRPVQKDRDPFFVEVGWRMGPALHAARRAMGRIHEGAGIPSGVQQAPHQRCGHFRRFRIGKGRTGETTRFVMPYWVRLDLLAENEDPITTVVPVDEQRRDPLRIRGLRQRGARQPESAPDARHAA